ncbi:hypothetical protein F5B21DRAFT_461311 [Xylaria acuta]|nr:hypothetical protein F5B21DRAFT_461311 [Xylaria acuta]
MKCMVFGVCVWISARCCHLMLSLSMTTHPPIMANTHTHTHSRSSTCSSASSGVSVELHSHPMGLVGSKAEPECVWAYKLMMMGDLGHSTMWSLDSELPSLSFERYATWAILRGCLRCLPIALAISSSTVFLHLQ